MEATRETTFEAVVAEMALASMAVSDLGGLDVSRAAFLPFLLLVLLSSLPGVRGDEVHTHTCACALHDPPWERPADGRTRPA